MTEQLTGRLSGRPTAQRFLLGKAEPGAPRGWSLRWKLLLTLFVLLAPAAVLAAYGLSEHVLRGHREAQLAQLSSSTRAAGDSAAQAGERLLREALRLAADDRLAANVGDSAALQGILEPLAESAELDYALVAVPRGDEIVEVAGVQLRNDGSFVGTQGAPLGDFLRLRAIIAGEAASAMGIARAMNIGYVLFAAEPIHSGDRVVGVAVTSIALKRLASSIRGGSLTHVALYNLAGTVLHSTLRTPDAGLALPSDVRLAALDTATRGESAQRPEVPVRSVTLEKLPHDAAYIPLVLDHRAAGVIGLFQANNRWLASESSRQLIALAFSGLAVVALAAVFAAVSLILNRVNRITRAVEGMAAGEPKAQAALHGLKSNDEIGALAKAIDQLADQNSLRQQNLESLLRQQRYEAAQFYAALEALPDGVVVLDLLGRIVMMNATARTLLGVEKHSPERLDKLSTELTRVVTPMAFSEPQRIPVDSRMLHAQAAAMFSARGDRIGTVVLLRDVTRVMQHEHRRAALLDRMEQQIGKTISQSPDAKSPEHVLRDFVHEINRSAVSLQRLINDIRELATLDAQSLRADQRPLAADVLLWTVAQEWQPLASESGITIHVLALRRGLMVRGDERRLRRAIGNLIDNAIKYTGRSGQISLTLRTDGDERFACFSVQDSGVGISADDLPHMFQRFYRGTPRGPNGIALRVPGTGQGLFITRRIIEAHGGTIRLRSKPGEGTEVLFTLPLIGGTADEAADRAAVERPPALP